MTELERKLLKILLELVEHLDTYAEGDFDGDLHEIKIALEELELDS